ncbi:ATP-binding protein [Labrys wisconsinensis]|nr:ATP-binding protein [Labrys wisconsinensis]
MPAPWPTEEGRATVGRFLAIQAGRHRLIGMITEVLAHGDGTGVHGALANVDLMGEIRRDEAGRFTFQRGVAEYPGIGDYAAVIGNEELRLIYKASARATVRIGQLHQDRSIEAHVDVDSLLTKHFAVLGSTGVGKSSGVAVLIGELIAARPDLRVFVLDGHNEYGRCFGERASIVKPATLRLPFWLFNFEELVDIVYGGRPAVADEVDILAELIPLARSMYGQYKVANDRLSLKKADPRVTGYTVDTPVPYLLQDLAALIDERMGKLENRASRMHYHRLLARIEAIRSDPRYAFMFENANVGGDTMASLLSHLFRLEPDGRPVSVMQLAGLPAEVMDAVVCVLCRMAFDFGLWSDGALPLLFVCEEAHRYASVDHAVGFGPARRALARIAKEGRKYGVYLGLVTQRPAELDPTILSQCSTLFAMRMTNDRDQALLRSAVSDAGANLLDFVPSLGTGEVVGFGEGVPLPARLTFRTLPAHLVPHSEAVARPPAGAAAASTADFVRAVVERWRGVALGPRTRPEEPAPPAAPPRETALAGPASPTSPASPASPASLASRLDEARYQILKR